MELTCTECGEKATNFHSRCCGVHMEGVITEKGELYVACEACGKYVGTIIDRKKLEDTASHIEHIISEWYRRTSRSNFDDFEEIYKTLCDMIGKDPKDLEKLYTEKLHAGKIEDI